MKAARAADRDAGITPAVWWEALLLMHEQIEERLRDLARRAGLSGVPPAVIAAGLLVAVLAVAWAGWRWWPRDDAEVGKDTTMAGAADGTTSTIATPVPEASSTLVFVHVVGAVRHPGVYELSAESRVAAALDAAGGMLPNAAPAAINLARPVADGEQILVPTKDEVASGAGAGAEPGGALAPSGGTAGGAAGAAAGALVNINTADAAALDTLPGVGPSTAQKIVADRDANGPFSSPDDLGRVSGIGPKRLEQLKGLVCVR